MSLFNHLDRRTAAVIASVSIACLMIPRLGRIARRLFNQDSSPTSTPLSVLALKPQLSIAAPLNLLLSQNTVFMLLPEIKEVVRYLFTITREALFNNLIIKRDAFGTYFAMETELSSLLEDSRSQIVSDGGDDCMYAPAPGTYYRWIEIDGNRRAWLVFVLSEEEISIYSIEPMSVLKAYLTHTYAKYNRSDIAVPYYLAKSDTWSVPKIRRPYSMPPEMITRDMQLVLDSVEQFKIKGQSIKAGKMHKAGYLLHGPPGTGKSSIVDIIAAKYGMKVYVIQLNGIKSDAALVEMIHSIEPYSMVVLDELEKQLAALARNPNSQITPAGLLTIFDGVPRLPHGTVVVITTNNLKIMDVFGEDFTDQLLREDRISHVFELKEAVKRVGETMTSVEDPADVLEVSEPDEVETSSLSNA